MKPHSIVTATVIGLLLSATSVVTAATPSAEPLLDPKLREMVASRVDAGAYPSLVIAVVERDRQEIIALGALGSVRPAGTAAGDARRAPDGDTVYEIGSVTKTFTALLLADAAVRGEVALEQPVQSLLRGYTIPRKGERAITLLDLATHSSGLPRLPENLLPKDAANPYADYTAENVRQFLAGMQLTRAPGEHTEYSNFGYGLLGHALAERATTTYADLVRTRIAAPLGMNDTTVALTPRMADRFAPGHDAEGKPAPPWDLGALQGAGALRSSGHDLVLYLRALMQAPAGPLGKAIAETVKARRPGEIEGMKIALAWMLQARAGRDVVWHSGMTGGYSSFVGFIADGKRGVAVLTNISRDVAELGLAALVPVPIAPVKTPKEIVVAKEKLDEYAGRYRLAPNFDLVVTVAEARLTVQATGQPALPVHASARDEFFYKDVDAQLSFRRNAAGKVEGVTLHQNGRDMPAPRVESEPAAAAPARKEIALDAATLAAYMGRYALAPGFVLQVTVEGTQLYVQATAQPRLPVYASARDEFFYKDVDAQLSFRRNDAGTIEGVTLHQGGREMPAPRVADPGR